mgnify:CR=1 FL=1
MVLQRFKINEMLIGMSFICLSATVLCFLISISNLHLYSRYQEIRSKSKLFSLNIQCHVDKILTHEIRDLNHDPSWTYIESKFLISLVHPLNNAKRVFEESSVPILLYNTVVGR